MLRYGSFSAGRWCEVATTLPWQPGDNTNRSTVRLKSKLVRVFCVAHIFLFLTNDFFCLEYLTRCYLSWLRALAIHIHDHTSTGGRQSRPVKMQENTSPTWLERHPRRSSSQAVQLSLITLHSKDLLRSTETKNAISLQLKLITSASWTPAED